MSENKIPKPSYSPSFGVRLLWWFGIYFAAQVPVLLIHPQDHEVFFGGYPDGGYPDGLAAWLYPFLHAKFSMSDSLIKLMAWGVYFGHLVVSLWVRTLKVFCVLLVGLLVLVVLDTFMVLALYGQI